MVSNGYLYDSSVSFFFKSPHRCLLSAYHSSCFLDAGCLLLIVIVYFKKKKIVYFHSCFLATVFLISIFLFLYDCLFTLVYYAYVGTKSCLCFELFVFFYFFTNAANLKLSLNVPLVYAFKILYLLNGL